MKDTIHTYYEAPGNPCIKNFISSWTKYGWNVHVHTREYGQESVTHATYMHVVNSFATINQREYENICYRRWYIYEKDNASGLFADYDVMNYGFTPADLSKQIYRIPSEIIIFNVPVLGGTPVIYATNNGIKRIYMEIQTHSATDFAEEFLLKGQQHISDMHIIDAIKYVPKLSMVAEYPATGVLVHYGGGKKASIDPAL